MEGLFIIIAIFIGIANFAAKQQQNQGNRNRQHSQRSQNPAHRQKNIPQSLKRTIMDLENSWNEGMKGEAEDKPVSMLNDEAEGIELEDRKKYGSLEYIEQSESLEGECNEHPEHDRQKLRNKAAAPKAMVVERKGDLLFDLTEDNLLRSIVMAEVLGPPRAIKRKIR